MASFAARLGPLPLINHFVARMGLLELLEQHVPEARAINDRHLFQQYARLAQLGDAALAGGRDEWTR